MRECEQGGRPEVRVAGRLVNRLANRSPQLDVRRGQGRFATPDFTARSAENSRQRAGHLLRGVIEEPCSAVRRGPGETPGDESPCAIETTLSATRDQPVDFRVATCAGDYQRQVIGQPDRPEPGAKALGESLELSIDRICLLYTSPSPRDS